MTAYLQQYKVKIIGNKKKTEAIFTSMANGYASIVTSCHE
jgi:hypothetical protein